MSGIHVVNWTWQFWLWHWSWWIAAPILLLVALSILTLPLSIWSMIRHPEDWRLFK